MCKAIEDLANERAKRKTLEIVKELMKKTNWTIDQTLEIINATEEEKKYILDALQLSKEEREYVNSRVKNS